MTNDGPSLPGLRNLIKIDGNCPRRRWLSISAPHLPPASFPLSDEEAYSQKVVPQERVKARFLTADNLGKYAETVEAKLVDDESGVGVQNILYSGQLYEKLVLSGSETSIAAKQISRTFQLQDLEFLEMEEEEFELREIIESTVDGNPVLIPSVKVQFEADWGLPYEGVIDLLLVSKGIVYIGEIKTYVAGPYGNSHKFLEASMQLSIYYEALRKLYPEVKFDLTNFFVISHSSKFMQSCNIIDCSQVYEKVIRIFSVYKGEVESGAVPKVLEKESRTFLLEDTQPCFSSACLECDYLMLCNQTNEVSVALEKIDNVSIPKLKAYNKKKSILKRRFRYLPDPSNPAYFVIVSLLPGTSERVIGVAIADMQGELLYGRWNVFPEKAQESREFIQRVIEDFSKLPSDANFIFTSKRSLEALQHNVIKHLRSSVREEAEKFVENPKADYLLKLAFLGEHSLSTKVFFLNTLINSHYTLPVLTTKNIVTSSKLLSDDYIDNLDYVDFYTDEIATEIQNLLSATQMEAMFNASPKRVRLTTAEQIAKLNAKKESNKDNFDSLLDLKRSEREQVSTNLVRLGEVCREVYNLITYSLQTLPQADMSSLIKEESRFLEHSKGLLWSNIWIDIGLFNRREYIEGMILQDIVAYDDLFVTDIDPSIAFVTDANGSAPELSRIRANSTLYERGSTKAINIDTVKNVDGRLYTTPILEPDTVYISSNAFFPAQRLEQRPAFKPKKWSGAPFSLEHVDALRTNSIQREWNKADLVLDQIIKEYTQNQNLIIKSPPGAGKTYTITSLCAASKMNEEKVIIVVQTRNQAQAIQEALYKEFGFESFLFLGGSKIDFDPKAEIVVSTAAKMAFNQDKIINSGEPYTLLIDEAWQMKFNSWMYLSGIDNWFRAVLVGDPGQIPPVNSVDTRMWSTHQMQPHISAPEVILNPELSNKFNRFKEFAFPSTRRFGSKTVQAVKQFYDFNFDSAYLPKRISFASNPLPELSKIYMSDWISSANLLPELITKLLADNELQEKEIGVICSRAYQVSYTQAVLSAFQEIRVETPERWQGLEAEVMLVIDPMFEPSQFSADSKRMCVIASRHKDAMILLTPENVENFVSSYFDDVLPGLIYKQTTVIKPDFYDCFEVLKI